MRTLLTLALGVMLAACAAPSHYAGQEGRRLKALSADEIAGYTEGRGMGFARTAELNGFPGPMHVLEHASALGLSDAQARASRELMDRHKAEVRDLGRQYIAAEEALEALFQRREVDPAALREATDRAARLQGRIRAAHLETHLAQTRLLTAEQVARYNTLRGYGGGHRHTH